MSTTDCGTELDLVHGRRGPEGRLAFVMLRAKSVWRAFRNRMAANSLYDLDDSQLNDIGITRHDVVTALDRTGVMDDPTRLLAGVARQRAHTRFVRQPRR